MCVGETREAELRNGNGGLRQLFHCEQLLGVGLRKMGCAADALPLHRSVARDWAALDGDAHDNALTAQYELAQTLHSLGQAREAISIMRSIVRPFTGVLLIVRVQDIVHQLKIKSSNLLIKNHIKFS